MPPISETLPLVLFEDEHLLVANKPAGWNTHAPSPWAGEGLYDWLRHHEPRWASLAIIHRLDKETSGVIVFGKTALANRSLTQQFTDRLIHKKYRLVTDRPVAHLEFMAKSVLTRAGQKYVSRKFPARGDQAETRFRVLNARPGQTTVLAEPVTGRTHQIRVHAVEHGFPILGDLLYGGSPARRLFLHAEQLSLRHPATGAPIVFTAPADFQADPALALREAFLDSALTNTYRLIHGAPDGWPDWYVDRLGPFLLSQSEQPLTGEQTQFLQTRLNPPLVRGVYHKRLTRRMAAEVPEASPQWLLGESAPEPFFVRENGLQYALSFNQGCSVGLFLDQRENRRRFLTGYVGPDFPLFQGRSAPPAVLNTFAYTCGFSVCAARAGAHTTSLDLSRKYLDWGRQNFALNQLDPDKHEFICGDVFDWLRRLRKKGRGFDLVVLDPPTFSRSKAHGEFRAQKDYARLVLAALPLLIPGGVLFASSNAARWDAQDFMAVLDKAIAGAGRAARQRLYLPQPPDFPSNPQEPPYLKTAWLRIQ